MKAVAKKNIICHCNIIKQLGRKQAYGYGCICDVKGKRISPDEYILIQERGK